MEMFQNAGTLEVLSAALRNLTRGMTVGELRTYLLKQGMAKTEHTSSIPKTLCASALRDAAVALYEELAFHV